MGSIYSEMENGFIPETKKGTKGKMVWNKYHRRIQENNIKGRGNTRRK